ncbi:hypothetical protein KUV80_06460 [Fictibacillus nanhaiensis]|uniref:hypothetical protein n=1 Tax=Fictibacillus nanhaiensis TaxID=742169 RepID=UPI001C93F10D|nr:hypothetical protein [Fictibacillus nanhaiensis]MBY6036285.1 hypothetical protein [Fictibacillus nanhaiensis]
MRTVWYNNEKVCDLTPSEYEALCLLLPYWGLQMSEAGEEITGALSTFMIGIQGLTQQKVKELDQLLQHTGISITSNDQVKCDQRFYVDFYENHPMPLALNTPDKQLYYLNPATSVRFPVQSAIHKGITLKRKDGPLFLAVQPSYEKQIAEWISYLVIQSFLRFSFESLTSISETIFISCAEKVLTQVNPIFAAKQLPNLKNEQYVEKSPQTTIKPKNENIKKEVIVNYVEEEDSFTDSSLQKPSGEKIAVPQIRPFSAKGSLITSKVPKTYEQGHVLKKNAQAINPFKSSSHQEKPIQPFNTNPSRKKDTSVIRPFQTNQNTPSMTREYTDNASSIFRKRRDEKRE